MPEAIVVKEKVEPLGPGSYEVTDEWEGRRNEAARIEHIRKQASNNGATRVKNGSVTERI